MTELRISNITLRGITHAETRHFAAILRTFEFIVHRSSDVETSIAIVEVSRNARKRLIIDRYAPSPLVSHPLIPTIDESLTHLREIRWRDFMSLVNNHPRVRTKLTDPDPFSFRRRWLTEEGWKKLDQLDLAALPLTPRQREIAATIIRNRSVRKACEELKLSSFWVGTIWKGVRVFGLPYPDDEPYDPAPIIDRDVPLTLRVESVEELSVLGFPQFFKIVVTHDGQIAILEEDDAGDLILVGPYTPPPLPYVPPGAQNYPYGGGRSKTPVEAELREIDVASSRPWTFREWVNTHPARRANI